MKQLTIKKNELQELINLVEFAYKNGANDEAFIRECNNPKYETALTLADWFESDSYIKLMAILKIENDITIKESWYEDHCS